MSMEDVLVSLLIISNNLSWLSENNVGISCLLNEMKVPQEKQDSAEETRLPAPASWNLPRREHNDTPRASVVGSSSVKVRSCRVDGCPVSLLSFRRKHGVCEIHCKAPSVIVQGLVQRFCQTCSRFQVVSEFDGKKRSCRRTLAERNEKRRKSLQDFDSRNASKSSAILPDPPAPNSSPDCGTLLDPPEPRCDENLNLPSPDAQSEEEP